jgi:peptidoglycan-binding protein CsiV
MKITLQPLFTILIMQMVTFNLYANETGYEVELIIFEDSTARYLRSEDWTYNDMQHNKKNETLKKDKKDPEYKQIGWKNAKLSNNLKRLENNSNYRILVTKRWKQTGLDRKHAFKIPVASINAAKHKTSKLTNSKNVKIDVNTASEFEVPPDTDPYLTGSVKLIMSRYLHFNIDLQYTRPQQDENGDIKNLTFPVVNERRMRSREVHYIDHPLVGVVVLATPYKIKSAEDQTDTSKYKTM